MGDATKSIKSISAPNLVKSQQLPNNVIEQDERNIETEHKAEVDPEASAKKIDDSFSCV